MHGFNEMNFNTQRPNVVQRIEQSRNISSTSRLKRLFKALKSIAGCQIRRESAESDFRRLDSLAVFSANSNRLAP